MRVMVTVFVEVRRADDAPVGGQDLVERYADAGVGMVRTVLEAADAERIEVAAGWGSEQWAVDLISVDRAK